MELFTVFRKEAGTMLALSQVTAATTSEDYETTTKRRRL
jgi:hypothetical protein